MPMPTTLPASLPSKIDEREEETDLRPVHPPSDDPFEDRDEERIAKLGDDIVQNGLLNPIILWERPDGCLETLLGETRRRACILKGLYFQKCKIWRGDFSPLQLTKLRYSENKHQKGVTDAQEAAILVDAMRRYGWSQAEACRQFDVDKSKGNKLIKPIRVFDETRVAKIGRGEGCCPFTTAASLARITDVTYRNELFDKAVAGLLTRERAKPLVDRFLGKDKRERPPRLHKGKTPGGLIYHSSHDLELLAVEAHRLLKAVRLAKRLNLGIDSLGDLMKPKRNEAEHESSSSIEDDQSVEDDE